MSERYSTSPSLVLSIGNSRIRRCLYGLCWLCTLLSLALIYERGYPVLSALLLLPSGLALVDIGRDPMAGTTLRWVGGQWSLCRGKSLRRVRLLPSSCCLPWLIHVAWRDQVSGARGSLWLFADSAPADVLRLLRVRLLLEH